MRLINYIVFLMMLYCLGGCSASHEIGLKAIATVEPLNQSTVSGEVIFEQLENAVKVSGRFEGLTPNSKHGFHVHQFGDLSADDGSTAGGHFNPENHPHGLPPQKERHAGSFGNILADENGVAFYELIDDSISIQGQKNSILGRSVIVHANQDDGSQPSGNAGPRIGGGVIGFKNNNI